MTAPVEMTKLLSSVNSTLQQICHLDRSEVEWRDLRLCDNLCRPNLFVSERFDRIFMRSLECRIDCPY